MTLPVGSLQTNCYIVIDNHSQTALIIDPGDDAEYIKQIIIDHHLKPIDIIATHGHFDHILAAWALQQDFKIPFKINTKDLFLVKRMQETAKYFLNYDILDLPPEIDHQSHLDKTVKLGDNYLEVILTPGHTPGGVALYNKHDACVFVGDTIFAGGGVGRTDFSYSNQDDLRFSIKKILSLPSQTVIYAGHGETTTIKDALHYSKV